MPGVSPQDARSEYSESSARSSDSRTQGKKVSFNKAVRVKQYPWQPDEPPELEERPDRRFWFKVYRNSSNPPVVQPNTWRHNDRSVWNEIDSENIHDSLSPIAEDDDTGGVESRESGNNGVNQVVNGNHFNARPLDPPVDYNDDRSLFSRTGRYSLRRLDHPRQEFHIPAQRQENHITRESPQHRTKAPTNSMLSPLRNTDFRRPTIASAAKRSSDKPFKQPIINVRLPRPVAKETPFNKRNGGSLFTSNQKLRERRSKSNDDVDRFRDRTNRIDKAVSTEDLSTGLKKLEADSSQRKSNKDKATQCSGTLTNFRKISENTRSVLKPSKPTLSAIFTHSEANSTMQENTGHSSSNNIASKQLSLHGTNCLTNNGYITPKKVISETKVPTTANLPFNDANSLTTNGYNHERFEYDYITDTSNISTIKSPNVETQQGAERKTATNDIGKGEKHKRSSWKTLVDKNIDVDSIICNDEETENYRFYTLNADKRSSSTIGHVQGKQVPMSSKKRHLSSDGITKMSFSNGGPINRNYINNSETKYTMLKDHSSPNSECRYSFDDVHSPIDWSTSGFRLGARSANHLSNSDSECMVHRRAPLLMYIPGVSHHDRPAVEDDRLSARNGFSRSEGEDDLSPMSLDARNVFSRRYSMPHNGKLNFSKWKST